jgi:hypothetical protein
MASVGRFTVGKDGEVYPMRYGPLHPLLRLEAIPKAILERAERVNFTRQRTEKIPSKPLEALAKSLAITWRMTCDGQPINVDPTHAVAIDAWHTLCGVEPNKDDYPHQEPVQFASTAHKYVSWWVYWRACTLYAKAVK